MIPFVISGPSGRARPPSGLKLIRKIADRLEKENYPEADETGYPFSKACFALFLELRAEGGGRT